MIHLPVPFINSAWNKKELLKETQFNLGLHFLKKQRTFLVLPMSHSSSKYDDCRIYFHLENMYQYLKQEIGSLKKVKLKAKII